MLILLFLFFIPSRGLVIILHELGHAIPAILLTKKEVTIYIGSHGNKEKNINFKIGLLDVWMNYQLLSWKNGLCVPSEESISINRQITYTLCGPLSSSIVASTTLFLAFAYNLNDVIVVFCMSFFLISILDLIYNLYPKSEPIEILDGKITYNDGQLLLRLFRLKKFKKENQEAFNYYNNKEYEKALVHLEAFLKSGLQDAIVYQLAVSCNIMSKNFERAKQLFHEYESKYKLTSDDYANGGLIYSRLDRNEEALAFYDKSLELNANNLYSLNNKGFSLIVLNRYEESIPLFDQVLKIDVLMAYAHNNRGHAKIKTGKIEEGLKDIEKSIEIDENNSYAYRNLGIYHFEKGEIATARELFLKSKKLDPDTYGIDDLIRSTEININQN